MRDIRKRFGQNLRTVRQSKGFSQVHIPAHRDRPFRLNVTACSGRS